MKTRDDARALADSLVKTGMSLGRRVVAVLTDMSEPLGFKVGNFLEVEESIACLRGEGPRDVMEITLRLTAWMIVAAGIEKDVASAEERCRRAIADGSAMDRFRANVEYQGGRLDELDAMEGSARGDHWQDITAGAGGYVTAMDALAVGMAGVALGVGRDTAADPVEALAGIELYKKTGDPVAAGEPVMRLWAQDKARLEAAVSRLSGAVEIGKAKPEKRSSLILEEIAL